MYKIGVIGDRDTVIGFMAVGFSAVGVDSPEAAAEHLKRMARSGEYGVIFITEHYAAQIEDAIEAYRDLPVPAIVTIPDPNGTTGYGMSHLRQAVVRATGVDILEK